MSKPFTRIHRTVDWRKKEVLTTEASYVGLECQVSPGCAGGLVLMVEIIGAPRYAADNPTFPPYVVPTQPLSSPSLPAIPTSAQIRTLTDKNNLLKRDWAVMMSFLRGVSKNIHDGLDLEFLKLLQHARYNYLKVLPR